MSKLSFDVVVFGGGMVGAATALGFVKKGYQVAIVEPLLPKKMAPHDAPDMRVSAISLGSEQLLGDLGAWRFLMQNRLRPYQQLSVWEETKCKTCFHADELSQSHLGNIMENRHLQLAIHQALQAYSDSVSWFAHGDIVSAQTGECQLDGTAASATLMVAADGGSSQICRSVGIGGTGWRYQQQVLAIAITTELESVAHTFQQFSPDGPMAYLPLFERYASLVWYLPPDKVSSLQTLSNADIQKTVLAHFPELHSDFKVTDKVAFPIIRNHANRYSTGRVALCGDAAHTINPLAGQGVNIGFKDVQQLIQLDLDKDLASQLTEYENVRRPENLQMMTLMDLLNLAFSNNNPILKAIRNSGLYLAERSGPVKTLALKRALGI